MNFERYHVNRHSKAKENTMRRYYETNELEISKNTPHEFHPLEDPNLDFTICSLYGTPVLV